MTHSATVALLQSLVALCGAAPFAAAAWRTRSWWHATAWWLGAAFAAFLCFASDPVAVALDKADIAMLGAGCGL